MIRCYFVLLIALTLCAGCVCAPAEFERPDWEAAPWNTAYLIDANPSSITSAQLAVRATVINNHYWTYAQHDGVVWPPLRSDASLTNPDIHTRGGDSGLFTGHALAAYSFRYMTDRRDEHLDDVLRSLNGMWLLTHATGSPGVICRQAFPADIPNEFSYPDKWGSRIESGFVNTGPPLITPIYPSITKRYTYYTRATKDQLTGVVLGLACAWRSLDPAQVPLAQKARAINGRAVVSDIVNAVYNQLIKHDWYIRDERGENDTSADYVDGLLRVCVLGLMTHCVNQDARTEYDDEFTGAIREAELLSFIDRFNNYQQYFAYNLRTGRALTIWMLDGPSSTKGRQIARFMQNNVWANVRDHQVAYFAYVQWAMNDDADARKIGFASLQSLSLKPLRMWSSPYVNQEQEPGLLAVIIGCTGSKVVPPHLRKSASYTTWEKQPWDVSAGEPDKEGLESVTGLDYLLPYWFAKWWASR